MSDVCGSTPITVGLADGYGANSWRKISRSELEAEAKQCPAIKKVIYTDAQGSAQKAISDINTLVSQGANAIIVLPDAGPALIPAMRAAMRAGVKVVITPGDIGGKVGQDYVAAVYDSPEQNGRVWAEWMVKQLHGRGNVVFLGGTPGNPVSPREAAGVREVFADHPDMKLLADPVDTNWDVAKTQQVMAGLLTRFPKIDGIISDYGGSTIGAIRAIQSAGRTLVPIATNDFNQLGCLWKSQQQGKGFPLATVSSRPWITRLALRQAVAATEGKHAPDPAVIKLSLFEDSTSSDRQLAVRCDTQLPPDVILSSTLTSAEMATLFGN
ncbi:substrate-binding domain-containing protein [Streptosporangium subroseum]|uniref:substrate-binding domain-containing protein n=1 Tax=Streptosporangium subroseum TaxID=106412 RepID=UPI00343BE180